MLAVKLTRLKSNHKNLRTDDIVGKCTHIPEVGEFFMIFAPPLVSGNFRVVNTSEIQTCTYDETARAFNFTTRNSEYLLTVLDDKNPFDYALYKHV